MSNTDKDAPYWVRRNDPTVQTVHHHYHWRAGKPSYGHVKDVLDEDGNPVWMEQHVYNRGVERPYFNPAADKRKMWEITRPNGDIEYVKHPWMIEGNIRRQRLVPVYSTIYSKARTHPLLGHYPEICDAHEPERRPDPSNPKMCHKDLATSNRWFHFNRPMPEERRAWHGVQRRRERDALKTAVKRYDSTDEEWWDDELEGAQTRQRRHNGWWF